MKRILTLLLCAALTLSLVVPSLAAQSEQETAAAWLKENGILTGDQNGNLNLDSSLTRAELAVILTRLSDDTGDMGRNAAYYRTICPFTDVPEWAMPYAGYCAEKKLMAGYGNKQFGPNDPVTPAAACTVMLRYLDCPANQWSYATACDKATELGLLPVEAAAGPSITRGNIAILIYRALNGVNPGNGADTTVSGVGDGYLTNGKPITENNVLELLHQIEKDWPTGTVWGTHNTPGTHKNEIPSTVSGRIMRSYGESNVYGCGAYASMVSSLIFGDAANSGRKLDDISELRPGDIVFLVSPEGKVGHVAVALESPNQEGRFHRTDGNHGETVQWPDAESLRSYSLSGFSGYSPRHLEVWTRYPESVPYTGNSIEVWPIDSKK
ncbi:S-layer homology domain-containing protein [Colidextribacter sp. OB.20]|uniref:S-layer homology domain-containing protein n=1 Tax=Colidextribacter sp. OB.20 TaxID=2304568 RepID=UPI00136CEE28|nr:S-layer homology domain-containing protein [Colidextribacter sp. OB.20]NBI11495.1 S-layer homology domain-containing protein [Colidextribacter sp. OB.20]